VRCHKVSGNVGEAGPDLTLIGKNHTPEYLLAAPLRPNDHIAPGFDVVTLTLKNGNTETGSVASEDDGKVTIKRADGSTVDVAKAQIAQRATAPSSMPDIYGQVLNRAQIRDMVAFLKILNAPWPDTEGGMNQSGPRAMQKVAKEGQTGGHE
jgi:quinoprotein glucose dehydrogenase